MFTLKYICENCGHVIPAETTDGRVNPPPDLCLNCVGVQVNTVTRRSKRREGSIHKGLLLEVYSDAEKAWRVLCLFCKKPKVVRYSNIGTQMSCGCLKGSPLVPQMFDPKNNTVTCLCKKCGLESEYRLLDDSPIVCRSGCRGKSKDW